MGFWTRPLSFLERLPRALRQALHAPLPLAPPFVMIPTRRGQAGLHRPARRAAPGRGSQGARADRGHHSVLLLDGGAHMEQRKLMLPAFHGEQMDRLSDLMAEVAEREVAAWPRDTPIELHPRMQRLTLEIILRAVFGLDPGPRLDALRERLAAMLAFGDRADQPDAARPRQPGGADPRARRSVRRVRAPAGRHRRDAVRADRRAPRGRTTSATTCSRCCSPHATRTASPMTRAGDARRVAHAAGCRS